MGSLAWWNGSYSIYIFSTSGRISCDPVAAEITYGTERLAMYLQGVDTVLILFGMKISLEKQLCRCS